jgi:hypothetical protein
LALPDPEDRQVVQQLVVDAIGTFATAGELIDHLDALSRPERRALLDRARVASGLDPVADVEGHRAFLRANEEIARRPRPPLPACAVCGINPTGAGGMPAEVPRVRRWHCPEHEHLAQAGDMDPPTLPISPHFQFADPAEVERERRAHARRAEEDRQRREERALRACEAREVERLPEEQVERELFGGRT